MPEPKTESKKIVKVKIMWVDENGAQHTAELGRFRSRWFRMMVESEWLDTVKVRGSFRQDFDTEAVSIHSQVELLG